MKYKFEDYWGSGRLVAEDKSYIKIPAGGLLVSYKGAVGKLYSVSDKSSHCGGHGMGDMTSCQGIISTNDMNIIIVNSKWGAPFDIGLIE